MSCLTLSKCVLFSWVMGASWLPVCYPLLPQLYDQLTCCIRLKAGTKLPSQSALVCHGESWWISEWGTYLSEGEILSNPLRWNLFDASTKIWNLELMYQHHVQFISLDRLGMTNTPLYIPSQNLGLVATLLCYNMAGPARADAGEPTSQGKLETRRGVIGSSSS